MSFRTSWLSIFLALVGCSSDNPGARAMSNQGGAGGDHATGTSHSGGSMSGPGGMGSAIGGAAPSPALTGSGGAAAGSSAGGASGSTSSGALGGSAAGNSAGSTNNGSSGGGGGALGRGPAPTFTAIYNGLITPSCGGMICHLKRPTPYGYDFSSKSAASAAWRSDVIAGDAEGSPMFQVLNFGIMPKDKPPLSIEQLFMVFDWINAGALDN